MDNHGKNNNDFSKRLICIIIGLILVFSGTVLLFLNEAFPSAADAVRSAEELTAANSEELNGKAVWIEGTLYSKNRATDDYISVSDCVVLRRYTEQYKSYDEQHSDGDNTWYTTEYRWEYHSATIIAAKDLKFGGYDIAEILDIDYNDMPLMNVAKSVANGHNATETFVYPKNNLGSMSNPKVGDNRVSYRFIRNGSGGVVVAGLSGNALIRHAYGTPPFTVSVYGYYYNGTIGAVISGLAAKNQIWLWVLRATGALMISVAFLLILFNLPADNDLFNSFRKFRGGKKLLVCFLAAAAYSAVICLLSFFFNDIFMMSALLLIDAFMIIPSGYYLHKYKRRENKKSFRG